MAASAATPAARRKAVPADPTLAPPVEDCLRRLTGTRWLNMQEAVARRGMWWSTLYAYMRDYHERVREAGKQDELIPDVVPRPYEVKGIALEMAGIHYWYVELASLDKLVQRQRPGGHLHVHWQDLPITAQPMEAVLSALTGEVWLRQPEAATLRSVHFTTLNRYARRYVDRLVAEGHPVFPPEDAPEADEVRAVHVRVYTQTYWFVEEQSALHVPLGTGIKQGRRPAGWRPSHPYTPRKAPEEDRRRQRPPGKRRQRAVAASA